MTHIAAFSKFLAYEIGGAEISTRELLTVESKKGKRITIISMENAHFLGKPVPKAKLLNNWQLKFIYSTIQLSRFGYVEYILNRNRIKKYFSYFKADELWAYGIMGPAAILGFHGQKCFFIRSESDLGIIGNYLSGIKKIGKKLYVMFESPASLIYRYDLKKALFESRVIANSNYMAKKTNDIFGIKPEVKYPPVNIKKIREKLAAIKTKERWVVFVGDSSYKGFDLVLDIAQCLQNINFRIFSRFVNKQHTKGNILWTPWQRDSWRVYEGACLVIVPSQWNEAYGRIARESYLLGIPVLVSKTGGLPETVEYNNECIIREFSQASSWITAIKSIL